MSFYITREIPIFDSVRLGYLSIWTIEEIFAIRDNEIKV